MSTGKTGNDKKNDLTKGKVIAGLMRRLHPDRASIHPYR